MKPRLKSATYRAVRSKIFSVIANLKIHYQIVGIVFILAILVIFSMIRSGILSPEDTLYIAVVGPMSGEGKADGEEMLRGIRLCLNKVNEEGGVNGKQVKLIRFDDQNDPELARERALEVVEGQKALVVLGHFSGPASIKAGKIYKKEGFPAISGSAQENEVTEGNAWYFRTTFNHRSQAVFLAYYVKTILQQNSVSIISSSNQSDTSLAGTFEQAFKDLEGEVKHTWHFSPMAEDLDQKLDNMTGEISERLKDDNPGMFLVAAGENLLAKIVVAMKRKSLNYPIITDYSTLIKVDFSEYPEEQKHPGYFLAGISVTSPFIFFDVADPYTQQFRDAFEGKYFRKPETTAALYYDAALAAIQAMKVVGAQGDHEQIVAERKQIRDYLASVKSIEEAIEGITGPLYFDKDGTADKPQTIGIFENRKVISAFTQLKLADPRRIADIGREEQAGRVLIVHGKSMYRTNVVYTGIDLHEVSDFNIEKLSYVLDFDLWFRYRGQFDAGNIEFLNAVEPIRLAPEQQKEDSSTPLKMHAGILVDTRVSEGITYRLYRVKGRFKADFLPGLPVFFREHVLGLSFRHRSLTRNNLIYVPDTLFMYQISKQSFWEKLKQAQILRSIPGWAIDVGEFFQDNFERISLANPKNLKLQKFTENYSRFNAAIWIRKDEFTLRGIVSTFQGMIPAKLVNYLLWLSCIMAIILAFAGKVKLLAGFSKTIWCGQAFFVILLLLCAERVFASILVRGNIDIYYQKLLILTFDVLWWIIGAFLLMLAVEQFLWKPLRKRTERPVPRVLRHSVTFVIYLLTFFGIVAFVFGREITSLLATSGVFAMILAFSNKVDISNMFAGIGISLSHPFRIDDWVKIGDCEEGQVVDMTSRTTKIQTRDYSMLSIPNTTVASSVIENFNYPDARFRLQFTLETFPIYHPERVQKILLDAVLSTDGVLKDPEPVILFQGQGDSSAIYTVVFYIDDYAKKPAYKQAVWKRVWIHLERAGIELATPRREILYVQAAKEDVTNPLNVLRKVDLFEPLSGEAKTSLSQCMRKRHFPPGETIVQQGESGKSLCIILEGAVGLWVQSEDGTPIEVARLGSGDVFGEMQLLTGKARRFGIISITDTYLFQIMKEDLALFIQKNPELAERFSKKLSERQMVIDTQKDLHEAQQIDKEKLSSQILEKIQQFFGLTLL